MFTKLFSGVVTAAMAFTFVVTPVSAQSVPELLLQLEELQKQLAALQGGGSTSTGACYTFTSDLTIGSTGTEVTNLQTFLESQGFFTYAGAKGYFGSITQSALAGWQAANGVAPAAGYWGPISRAAYNAWCATQAPTTDDDDDDFTPTTGLNGDGEADIEDFEVDDADDTDLEEGDEEVEVAEISFEVEESDVLFSRLDVVFESGSTTIEDDPWKAFDMLYLEYDGDIIDEVDASDDDNWDEDNYDGSGDTAVDEYRIRFRGLDLILDEGEHTFYVLADVANGLDNVDSGTEQEWEIFVPAGGSDGALFISPNGVTAYEPSTTSDRAEVTLGEAGGDAELKVSEANSSPDATTLLIEETSKEEHTVMTLELRAEEDDVEVNEISVFVDLVHPTLAATSVFAVPSTVIDDVYLRGDGVNVDTDSASGLATTSVDADGDGVSDDIRITYDFDLDDANDEIELDEDEEIELDVVVNFKGYTGNYPQGTLVRSVVTSALADSSIDAESQSEDLGASQISGSATGDLHSLYNEGLEAELVGGTESGDVELVSYNDGADQKLVFRMEVDVTANGETFYVPLGAATSTVSATNGFLFDLESDTNGVVSATTGSITAYVTAPGVDQNESDASGSNYFEINAGDTETFIVTVEVDNEDGYSGVTRVQLTDIKYVEIIDEALETFDLLPSSDWQSYAKNLN